jgi:hypothetical protein
MSHDSHDSHNDEPWLDTWWPLFLIIYGLLFVILLTTFRPG